MVTMHYKRYDGPKVTGNWFMLGDCKHLVLSEASAKRVGREAIPEDELFSPKKKKTSKKKSIWDLEHHLNPPQTYFKMLPKDKAIKNPKNIFTVQVLYIEKTKADKKVFCDNGMKIIRHRLWGWYPTFARAEEVVLQNITDIYENGYYNYALINEVPPGICVMHEIKDTWYSVKYDRRRKGLRDPKSVLKCLKPIHERSHVGMSW